MARDFGTGSGIYFFRSTDGGDTFGPSGGTLITPGAQGAFVEVGADHSVYAFWWNGSTLRMRKFDGLRGFLWRARHGRQRAQRRNQWRPWIDGASSRHGELRRVPQQFVPARRSESCQRRPLCHVPRQSSRR